MRLRAQGATEYLVLLAVVLIIALVAIALLGFFPGTATDAQLAESKLYWQSASPIAITESGAIYYDSNASQGYLRVRNTGAYQITITALLGNGASISRTNSPDPNQSNMLMSQWYYLSPGEEKTFGRQGPFSGLTVDREIGFVLPVGSISWGNDGLKGADTVCNAGSTGIVVIRNFGFEYTTAVEGQVLTKRQIGTKPLMVRCG